METPLQYVLSLTIQSTYINMYLLKISIYDRLWLVRRSKYIGSWAGTQETAAAGAAAAAAVVTTRSRPVLLRCSSCVQLTDLCPPLHRVLY